MKIQYLILAVLSLSGLSAPERYARPAQIILVRHADKPLDPADPHLSPAGVERAKRLATFLATDPSMIKYGSPVAIFATQTTKHDDGQRTQETMVPLARKLGLQVQTPFLGKEYGALARMILSGSQYSGKTIVVCWNHETLPELAAALGVNPMPRKWKGAVFDQVYVITYAASGKAELRVLRYQ
ncbi:MAG TPA: histidine phosphatase family protein [Gemmatimonadaceae bacterium]|jgi:phosphohistidine phosphatase SixA|nr:histidine phosphatase family protein [Gemmatimonadaceae bacterium]